MHVLTGGDADTGQIVVPNGPDRSLELQRNEIGMDAAVQGDEEDESAVQPVDVLVPVGESNGGFGDVDGLLLLVGGRSRGFFSSHGWYVVDWRLSGIEARNSIGNLSTRSRG